MKTHNFHATRAVDVFRGRTGLGATAGTSSLLGIPFVGTLGDGQVWVYDAGTGTLVPGTVLTDAGAFLTSTEGEGHKKVTNLAASGAVTIDCSLANIFDLTLTGNITISITNPPDASLGGIIQIILRQGGSGSYTVTWPASVYWQAADGTNAGSAPTLHTVVGAQDDITLATLDGGTTWGGEHGGLSSPLTTKGDLWGFSTGNARVGVGTYPAALIPDPSASTGLRWATAVGLFGLLVEDGATAPPVSLYSEDGTDWIYADG